MKILVCFKYIHDENEITVNADRTLELSSAPWVISPYDLNAIEAAMQLSRQAEGSTVEMMTVAGDVIDNSKMKKAALSRGPQKMYGIKTADCGDMYTTASQLSSAIEKIGDVDLVIFGEGSGDMYSQTLGNMVGALLGVSTVNGVDSISVCDGGIEVTRSNGARVEKLQISGKAVLSVTSDICTPHIPSLKDIMAAGKKPVEVMDAASLSSAASATETISVLAPERTERQKIVFKASDENGIAEFAKAVKKYM